MKKRNFILILFPIIAFILELIPYGAVLNFANPEGIADRHTYSYFSLTPFGYANFAPFIVAILTCAILILTVIYLIKANSSLYTATLIISAITFIISLAPMLFGISNYSVIGAFISASLIIHSVLMLYIRKN